MAQKVNTKFIILLSLAIVFATGGLGAVYVWSQLKGAERNFEEAQTLTAEAETLMASGNEAEAYETFFEASKQYGIAVNKQPQNLEFLNAYIDALLRTRPEDPDRYLQTYQLYIASLGTLAQSQPNDPVAQLDFLLQRDRAIRRSGEQGIVAGFESFVAEAEDRYAFFENEDNALGEQIRGLRGRGQVERMLRTIVDSELRDVALEDLRAALDASRELTDDDYEGIARLRENAAEAIIRWHVAQVRTLASESRPRDAIDAHRDGMQEAQQIAEEHPDSLRVALASLMLEQSDPAVRTMTEAERNAFSEHIVARRGELLDRMMQADRDDLTSETLGRFASNAIVPGRSRDVQTVAIRAADLRPNDPAVLTFAARVLELTSDLRGAIGMYERITQMPTPTLDLTGVNLSEQRTAARIAQASIALDMHRLFQDPEAKAEAFEQAKQYRDQAEETAGVRFEDRLRLIDAEIAFINGEFRRAQAMFEQLRADLGTNPAILAGLARSAKALGNREQAIDLYQQLTDIIPIRGGGIEGIEHALELADLYAQRGSIELALNMIQDVREVLGNSNQFLEQREAALRGYLAEQLRGDIASLERDLAELDEDSTRAAEIRTELRLLTQQLAEVSEGLEVNPVVQALGSAQRLIEAGRTQDAVAVLDTAVDDNPDTPELRVAFLRLLSQTGDDQRLRDELAEAIQRFPNNSTLNEIDAIMSAGGDEFAAAERLIEDRGLEGIDRELALTRSAIAAGRADEARAAVDRALAIEPDNPDAIELAFSLAIGTSPIDEQRAERFVREAQRTNADQLEGLTYEARLALTQGDAARAVELFEEATARIPSEPRFWRLLGTARLNARDIPGAIEAFERAIAGRTDDPTANIQYAEALRLAGRNRDALAAIGPDSPVFARVVNDPQARNLWLNLEAAVGDAERAIEERAEWFDRSPANGLNSRAYVESLLQRGRVDEARRVFDRIQADDDAMNAYAAALGMNPAVARAVTTTGITAASGDVRAAADQLRRSLPELAEQTGDASPHIAFADFALSRSGQFPELAQQAFEALEAGRAVQSDRLEADLAMAAAARQRVDAINQQLARAEAAGNIQAVESLGAERERFADLAIESLRNVENASDDPDRRRELTLQRAALQLAVGDTSEARSAAQNVLQGEPDNLPAILMLAEIAATNGETARARDLYDRAVEAHPDDARPFFGRARLNASEAALFPDVIADLDRVHEISPAFIDGWRLRFQLYAQRADLDRAFSDLRETIDRAPSAAEPLRRVLVEQLRLTGQGGQAAERAKGYAEQFQREPYWQRVAGQLLMEEERYREAAEAFRRWYETERLADGSIEKAVAAAGLLDARLRDGRDVTQGEVTRLLEQVQNIENVESEILMLRARAQNRLGDRGAALGLVADALEAAGDNPQRLSSWLDDLPLALGSQQAADRFVQNLLEQGNANEFLVFADLSRRARSGLPPQSSIQEGLALLDQIDANTSPDLALRIIKLVAPLMYTQQMYDEAVELSIRGLDIAPEDAELNNLVAYTLTKHLDRVNDAVPYADVAFAVAQNTPEILDTVGLVYLESGRHNEAVDVLERARNLAQTPQVRLPVHVHLAQAYLATEQTGRAIDAFREAETAFESMAATSLRDGYRSDLDELRDKLGL